MTDAQALLTGLFSPAGQADPYPAYRALLTAGPVHRTGNRFWVLGHAEAYEALRDPRFRLATQPPSDVRDAAWDAAQDQHLFASSLLYVRPRSHAWMRRLLSQPFSPRRLEELRPMIARNAGLLLDRLEELGRGGARVDLLREFAYPLPIAVISELVGVPRADRDWFRGELHRHLENVLGPSAPEAAAASSGAVEEYFAALIAERRRKPADDLISELIAARGEGGRGLSDRELLANVVFLYVAGFETTSYAIANGVLLLRDRPEERAAIAGNASAAVGFTDEVIRFDPPSQLANLRWASRDLTLAGHRVPEGSAVSVCLGAANRDPARYPDPDRFDPARSGGPSIAFSAGPHYCLGTGLARLETQEALHLLCRRFPGLRTTAEPVRGQSFPIRRFASFPVAVSP
ncbi:cytochrome P450 [Streptomyces xiamenensis]|uniref:cytochrome P450 n=1 Tax=Streptomyces xiamenensis TaxID=408015 RepID=UPI0037D6E1C9